MENGTRSLRLAAVAALLGAILTAFVVLSPVSRFALLAPSLHVAIETASGLAVLLAGYLVYGRFRHSGALAELLLVAAFAQFGFANLVLFAVPTAVAGERPTAAVLWAGLAVRLLGALMLAAAAAAPDRRLRDPGITGAATLGACVGLFAVVGTALAWLDGGALDPIVVAAADVPPLAAVAGTPVHMLQLVGMVFFAAAAAAFGRRAARRRDELYAWLAAAAVLGAFAWLHYFLFPSLYSDWVSTGDALRLGFYAVVLFASAKEIRRYWQRIAEAEVLEERRRLARELHDGVAQELAFIARRARPGVGGLDATTVGEIAAAAERGRTEARRAVRALSDTLDEPFDVALTQAVEHVAARAGIPVRCAVEVDTNPPPAAREHLIRIASEAVSNAVRHSHAHAIVVEFAGNGVQRLRVADDGVGFEPAAVARGADGGFGLRIMRERAARLGSELQLRSRPGEGTEVLVVLP
jgi:signal transduction histidine kinase